MDQTESNRLERIGADDEGIDAVGYTAGASNESALMTNDAASAAVEAIPDEPEQLKAQIEETRSSMGETIDAIQEKLSFSNIAEQVKETVSDQINSAVDTAQTAMYDATVGKAGGLLQSIGSSLSDLTGNLGNSLGGLTGNFGTTLGELTGNMGKSGKRLVQKTGGNTLPLLLIGLGAGLLLVQRSSGGKSRKRSSRDFDYDRYREMDDNSVRRSSGGGRRGRRSMIGSATETVGGAISSTTGAVGSVANTAYQGVSGAAGSAYEGVTGVAGSAYQGVAGAAGSAYQGVAGAASSAYEGVSGFAGTAYERAGDFGGKVQSQYQEQIESNPLVVGAVAAAIGAVVGFSIPNTEYENQWMGETRDQLVTQAQGTARQTLTGAYEQARTMVTETVGEAAKTVQEQAQG